MWQRKYAVAALAWMAFIWLLSNQPDLQSGLPHDFWWRKTAHILEFAILTGLWARVLGNRSLASIFYAALIALAYAGIDEWHQSWVAGRNGNPRDVIIDAVGVLLVTGWLLLLSRRRRAD